MKKPQPKPQPKQRAESVSSLAEQTGADRRSVAKWLKLEGLNPNDAGALDAIANHQQKDDQNIDPETGLTWFQAKQREETLKQRRENEIADRLKDETYMETAAVEKLITMFIGKLELVPVKLESEFSLEPALVKRLTQLLDEARTEMAKGVLKK